MPAGYQSQVNTLPAPGIAGDYSDANPRFTLDAGPGGLVAGPAGVFVGRFAWVSYAQVDADNAPAIVNSFGAGAPSGFVHREQQGLITQYLQDANMLVAPGFMITLHTRGGFWVKNDGTTQALYGQKAYANVNNGQVSFAATGNASSASITGSIASVSGTITGSVSGGVLTVTGSGASPLVVGAFLSGTVGGSGVAAGTQIVSQLSGTTNGVGTYQLNIQEQLVGSGTLNFSYGVLTVSAVGSGTVAVGALLGGTGALTAGTSVTSLGTGAGLTGTYYVNNGQTLSSGALTAGQTVETSFYALSSGLPGEVVKISPYISS